MWSKRKLSFIKYSIKIAQTIDNNMVWHFGALLVKNNKIISTGFNRKQTHTKSPSPYGHLHAEVDSIIGFPLDKLRGATLYVARAGYEERKTIMMSEPCEPCKQAIIRALIFKVYYTMNDNTIVLWDVRSDQKQYIEVNNLI
jgi:deoxycytidylate deaminase